MPGEKVVDIDIFITSRNGEGSVMRPMRITSRPAM